MNYPLCGVFGNAMTASDENITRRSDIIELVILINLLLSIKKYGRKRIFNIKSIEEELSKFKFASCYEYRVEWTRLCAHKISYAYHLRKGVNNVMDAMEDIGIIPKWINI